MSVNYYIVEQAYIPISYEDFESAIVIIGYADKGPSMVPVYFSDITYIEKTFGADSELSKSCLEAFYTGAKNIIAFRINGIYSTTTLNNHNGEAAMKIYAVSAGEVGNDIKVEVVDSRWLSVYASNGSLEKTYPLRDDTTINQLCSLIKRDAELGNISIIAEALIYAEPSDSLVSVLTNLDGGVDEDSVAGAILYERLDSIYSMLETLNFNSLVVLPIRYTDSAMIKTELSHEVKEKFFYNQLDNLCSIKANEGFPILAVISADEFVPELDIDMSGYVTSMKNKTTDLGDRLRRSPHIIVTRSWLNIPLRARHISSGAAALAGYISTLSPSINPLNKPIGRLVTTYADPILKYVFGIEQIKELSSLGITTFHETIRKGVCFANAVTSAPSGHSCSTIKNTRLSNYIIRRMSTKLDGFLGNVSMNPYASIDKMIDSELTQMVTDGIINKYSYTVTSNQMGSEVGIDITAVPCNDIATVSASIVVHL